MCVSELATNAILYTRSGLPGGTFAVTVQPGPGEVLVLVHDSGARTSTAPARAADEHGRGLCIVEALSGGFWGVEETSRGRMTWCRIPALYVPAQRRRSS
jgi:anti-sigma regulatory factor (Ser/Thr protein kinase)